MKKFWLVLVLSLFCLQSEGQILAGHSAVGIRVDTINLSVGTCATNFDTLNFTCGINSNVILNCNTSNYMTSVGSSSNTKSYLNILDSTIQIAIEKIYYGGDSYKFAALRADHGKLINEYINWSNDDTLLFNGREHRPLLGEYWNFDFYNKYIPIRKKYNEDYIYGWIFATGESWHFNSVNNLGGGCSYIHQITKFPKSLTIIKDTITCNSTYIFADGFVMNNIYQDTVYDFALPSSSVSCDSLVRTKLHVLPSYFEIQYDSICYGSSYQFIDGSIINNLKADTIHSNIFHANGGCDSIINTYVHVNPVKSSIKNVNLCIGMNYTFPNLEVFNNIVADTFQNSYFTTINGCDSIIRTNIHIRYPRIDTHYHYLLCGYSFTFPDLVQVNNIIKDTIYSSYFVSPAGCDSTIICKVKTIFPYNLTPFVNVLCGSNYTFPDGTILYNISKDTIQFTKLHCDTLMTTTLRVYQAPVINENLLICKGDSYMFPDSLIINNINSIIQHTSNLKTQKGCDSIIKTRLDIQIVNTKVTKNKNMLTANTNTATYQWYDCISQELLIGDTNKIFTSNVNGSFAVILKNGNCIDTSDCYEIICNNIFNKKVEKKGDYLISKSDLIEYQWLDCDKNIVINGETNQEFRPKHIGNYSSILKFSDCTDTSDCYYVDYINTDNFYYFDIYPNPTSSKITILVLNEDALNTKRELFNSLGQLVISTKENEIDVSHLPKGVYYLKIANQARKVLVQ